MEHYMVALSATRNGKYRIVKIIPDEYVPYAYLREDGEFAVSSDSHILYVKTYREGVQVLKNRVSGLARSNKPKERHIFTK